MTPRRETTTHGPRLDDQLKRETGPLEHGGHAEARAEEGRELEGAGEDERRAELDGAAGLPRDPALARRELSRHLRLSAFPADRERLLSEAAENDAPAPVVRLLESLPGGTYETVYEVWEAAGGELEPTEREVLERREDGETGHAR